MRLLWFWQLQKLHCNPGLIIVLQLLTGEGEQDSAWSQEPEVAGQSGESLVSQLLLSLTELHQFLVETEVGDGSISSNVGCEE